MTLGLYKLMKYPKLKSHVGDFGKRKHPVTKQYRHFEIIGEIQKVQSNAKHKILVLQRLHFSEPDEIQLRLGYYIIGKLPSMKDKWVWGQYATFLPAEDYKFLSDEAKKLGWF